MRRLELTRSAQADLAEILDRSFETFGALARRRYEALIEVALGDLRADPECIGSLDRPELGAAVRTYHLAYCRARARAKGAAVGDPRHLLAYAFNDERVVVLRVLHDAMDLARHVPPSEPAQ